MTSLRRLFFSLAPGLRESCAMLGFQHFACANLPQSLARACANRVFFNFCLKCVRKTLILKMSLKNLERSFKRLYLCYYYYYYYRLQAQAAQEIPQDPPWN